MTERLHFHFSLSCIGEGNGNPLQCSCLENPRDGASWWAAVYGVAQSRTRLTDDLRISPGGDGRRISGYPGCGSKYCRRLLRQHTSPHPPDRGGCPPTKNQIAHNSWLMAHLVSCHQP